MELKEAIKILEHHNRWRRGDDIPMTTAKSLGLAIDKAVEVLEIIEMKEVEKEFDKWGWGSE